jgi:GWxTD domain-containing protein
MSRLLVPLLLWLAWPPAAAAQRTSETHPLYLQATERLAEGDSGAAVALLRDLTRQQPRYGPGWLRLGAVLGDRAHEVERDFGERLEAQRALERAMRLMRGDPEPLLEYGLLLRKQQRRDDARRALDRAWQAAERRGAELPAAQRARLHYALGLIYQNWWEDWEGQIFLPGMAVLPPMCNLEEEVGFDRRCAASWIETLRARYPSVEHLKAEDRDRMLAHFRAAHKADPGHVDAAVALLGHLADAAGWDEFVAVASRTAAQRPDDARIHLFAGLGLHERGHTGAADAAFQRALALLPPADRRVFEDVRPLLPASLQARYASLDAEHQDHAATIFFAGRDPLYLTGASERRLEHYARLAWVDLKFAAPASGLRGWQNEMGMVWVRYGRPALQWRCCAGKFTEDAARGVFWHYEDGPTFQFRRGRSYRLGVPSAGTLRVLFDLREELPEHYVPRTITALHGLPHQLARFRGAAPGEARVEVYGRAPLDSLGLQPGEELQTGLFVFDAVYNPLISTPGTGPAMAGPVGLAYRFHLPAGTYRYGLEARAAGPDSVARPVARERETFEVAAYPEGRLALSDILLATSLRPRAGPAAQRAELLIVPKAGTTLEPGERLHLFYEIYGLAGGDGGYATIQAELAVEDATRRNVVDRLARGVEELFRRGERDTRVRWERTVPVRGDVAVDYLTVELNTREPGDYVVRVRVTDVASGLEAETVRRFRIVGPGS